MTLRVLCCLLLVGACAGPVEPLRYDAASPASALAPETPPAMPASPLGDPPAQGPTPERCNVQNRGHR